MNSNQELSHSFKDSMSVVRGILVLFTAVCILSLAAIFIRLSEQELSPNGTIFNRLWIGATVLGLWNSFKAITQRYSQDCSTPQQTYTLHDFVLLVVMASLSLTCLLTWAWSLTQTSVANSGLLHNMTPIFATLGGWIFLGNSFDKRFLLGMMLSSTSTAQTCKP